MDDHFENLELSAQNIIQASVAMYGVLVIPCLVAHCLNQAVEHGASDLARGMLDRYKPLVDELEQARMSEAQ